MLYTVTTASPLSSIKIGLYPNSRYFFYIDWDDKSKNNFGREGQLYDFTTGYAESACCITHTYNTLSGGQGEFVENNIKYRKYNIKIATGIFPGIYTFDTYSNNNGFDPLTYTTTNITSADAYKITKINKWQNTKTNLDVYSEDWITYWGTPTWVRTRPHDMGLPLGHRTMNHSFYKNYNISFSDDVYIDNFKLANSFYYTWARCSSSLSSFPTTNFANGSSFEGAWSNTKLKRFNSNSFPRSLSFHTAWAGSTILTGIPICDFPEAISFHSCCYGCTGLTSWETALFPKGRDFPSSWQGCTSLTWFPSAYMPKGEQYEATWMSCGLRAFPAIDFPEARLVKFTWAYNYSMSSFAATNFPKAYSLEGAWRICNKLKNFPQLFCPNVLNVSQAWFECTSLTSISFSSQTLSSAQNFDAAWSGDYSLSSFPFLNVNNGTTFNGTWGGMPNLRDFTITEFPSALSMINTWGYAYKMSGWNVINCPKTKTLAGCWNSNIISTEFGPISSPLCEDFERTWFENNKLTGFKCFDDTFKSMKNGTNCFASRNGFKGTIMPTLTWSSILTSLSALNSNNNVCFHGGGSKKEFYGNAAASYLAKPISEGGKGWTITDGGYDFDFIMSVNVFQNLNDFASS